VDVDPWLEPSSSSSGGIDPPEPVVRQVSGSVKERVLKMNSLIDQQDESEPLPTWDVDRWYQNYIITMGSQQDETEEPTASQLAALHKRVFIENRPPDTV
jgi:hypothetical protein